MELLFRFRMQERLFFPFLLGGKVDLSYFHFIKVDGTLFPRRTHIEHNVHVACVGRDAVNNSNGSLPAVALVLDGDKREVPEMGVPSAFGISPLDPHGTIGFAFDFDKGGHIIGRIRFDLYRLMGTAAFYVGEFQCHRSFPPLPGAAAKLPLDLFCCQLSQWVRPGRTTASGVWAVAFLPFPFLGFP